MLSDPEGSGLYNKIKHGVMFDIKEAEGTRRRHQVRVCIGAYILTRVGSKVDTVVEGM